VGQTDSTMRRYRISAHATGVACRHTFAFQPVGITLSQISSRLNIDPATAFCVCDNLRNPGFLQLADQKRYRLARHSGSRVVNALRLFPFSVYENRLKHLRRPAARFPLGRLGQTTDVAAAILFLASPAAAYVTGATLDVNGGLYAT
jgi:Enoyl-(Acyl carrier protein) reductase